tara:strand:+ start:61 stop:480 length:420 start_codon:yes stop_codon:yes gene_type:complete
MKKFILIAGLLLVTSNGWTEGTFLECKSYYNWYEGRTNSIRDDENLFYDPEKEQIAIWSLTLPYSKTGSGISFSVIEYDSPQMINYGQFSFTLNILTGELEKRYELYYKEDFATYAGHVLPRETQQITKYKCSKVEPLF